MFRSAIYLLTLISAGAILTIVLLSVPFVFEENRRNEILDDLMRAQNTALMQLRMEAFNQLSAAQSTALDQELVDEFIAERPQDDEEDTAQVAASPRPASGQLEPIGEQLARTHRQDLVIFLDNEGKVLASSHEEGPKREEDLSGLPPVQDALNGMRRDWIWARPGNVMLTAAHPISISQNDKAQVVGVAFVGKRIDSSMANDFADQIDPAGNAESRMDLAFVHNGRQIGSSAKDAQLQASINTVASGYINSDLPIYDSSQRNRVRMDVNDGQETSVLISAAQDSDEGRRIGIITVNSRRALNVGIKGLAVSAFTLELPSGQGPPRMLIFSFAAALFLIGLVFLSFDYNRPWRHFREDLKMIEANIEDGEFDIKRHNGIARQVSRQLNSIMTGLRKRLTRERRNSREMMIPPELVEPIEPDTPPVSHISQDLPQGLPFTDSESGQQQPPAAHNSRPVARPNTGQFNLVERAAPHRTEISEDSLDAPTSIDEETTSPKPDSLANDDGVMAWTREGRQSLSTSPFDNSAEDTQEQSASIKDTFGDTTRPPDAAPTTHHHHSGDDDAAADAAPIDEATADTASGDATPPVEAPPAMLEADTREITAPEPIAQLQPLAAAHNEAAPLEPSDASIEESLPNDFKVTESEGEPMPAPGPGSSPDASGAAWMTEHVSPIPRSAGMDELASALSNSIVEALSQDSHTEGQPVSGDDFAKEDSTLDISPEALLNLITSDKHASATEGDSALASSTSQAEDAEAAEGDGAKAEPDLNAALDDELDQRSQRPGALRAAVVEGPTAVDSFGVMRKLATDSMSESPKDMLADSAVAASASATPDDSAPEPKETDTAEIDRNDNTFQAALKASSDDEAGNITATQGLINSLQGQTPFPKESSQVRPFPKDLATDPPRRNPFVHQAPTTPGTSSTKMPQNTDLDQEYFTKLYVQFVETKKRCGEDTTGLTQGKFIRRLQRNKANLMERYKCRSVRFQVYVKNNKAALKATPIK